GMAARAGRAGCIARGLTCGSLSDGTDLASCRNRRSEGTSMRKTILALALWAITAAPLVATPMPALAQSTLLMVAHADLKILDPVWSTANITRNHGYLVYDVLFSTDVEFRIRPQMVERYEVSPDRLTWTFTLRDGLEWHDGTPVVADDCVASLRRWGA